MVTAHESRDALVTGEATEVAKLYLSTTGLRVWLLAASVTELAMNAVHDIQDCIQADLSAYTDENCTF